MAKEMKPVVVPRFPTEAEEAAWWDARRSEVELEIQQRMKQTGRFDDLAERTATEIDERAAEMTSEERERADSATRKIANQVAIRRRQSP
jgi:hypothetical protein